MTRRPLKPSPLANRPEPERAYVHALLRHQDSLGLDDSAFAREMEVSEGLWRGTKTGRRAIGLKLVSNTMDVVPHAVFLAAYQALIERAKARGGKRNGHADRIACGE